VTPAADTDPGQPRGPALPIADAFRAHERYLWGLAYRMTGSAADADDVVQEAFARAIERPPARADLPLRPWLAAVALNLARDALRARKRRAYVGPWLPAAVDSSELDAIDMPGDAAGAEARYDLAESASFAFLVALEELSAQQRAVLILRDVLDHSVLETAGVLGLSESNVKTTHHRARHAMKAYDEHRRPFTRALADETRATLERFVAALLTGDVAAAEALVVREARALSDGGGEYTAALRPIEGRDRVVRFLAGVRQKAGGPASFQFRSVNHLPALVVELDEVRDRFAPRFVMRCDVDAEGRIRAVHLVVASPKLARVSPLAADAMRA
jgi:RNA polymerase sigma-70 factor, ECF subfamily